MRIADTTAAERALQGATLEAMARRTAARTDARTSASGVPRAVTSTSLSLLTDPTSAVPRHASCRSASATPGSRYVAGVRSVAGNATRRPARHCRIRSLPGWPPTPISAPPEAGIREPLSSMRSTTTSSVTPDGPFAASVRSRPSTIAKSCRLPWRRMPIEDRAQRLVPRRESASRPSTTPARQKADRNEDGGRPFPAGAERGDRASARNCKRTRGWTGRETRMPAAMPAPSAIAGIAAGQRTTAASARVLPKSSAATGYQLPATS